MIAPLAFIRAYYCNYYDSVAGYSEPVRGHDQLVYLGIADACQCVLGL